MNSFMPVINRRLPHPCTAARPQAAVRPYLRRQRPRCRSPPSTRRHVLVPDHISDGARSFGCISSHATFLARNSAHSGGRQMIREHAGEMQDRSAPCGKAMGHR